MSVRRRSDLLAEFGADCWAALPVRCHGLGASHLSLDQLSMETSRPAGPGAARLELRDATAEDHAVVDAAYSVFDLSDPAGYRAFLRAQHACLGPIEEILTRADAQRVLPDWPSRRRAGLLAADLRDLGAATHAGLSTAALGDLRDPAAALGALYVLEGSRFGGSVLARRVGPGLPLRFLGAGPEPGAWRLLVSALDRHLVSERALAIAIASARAVFAAFVDAARFQLEPAHG